MGFKIWCSSNSLDKLVEIVFRWTCIHNLHTDIAEMYNRILLDKLFWRFQLYLWADNLMENAQLQWKVMKTLICDGNENIIM